MMKSCIHGTGVDQHIDWNEFYAELDRNSKPDIPADHPLVQKFTRFLRSLRKHMYFRYHWVEECFSKAMDTYLGQTVDYVQRYSFSEALTLAGEFLDKNAFQTPKEKAWIRNLRKKHIEQREAREKANSVVKGVKANASASKEIKRKSTEGNKQQINEENKQQIASTAEADTESADRGRDSRKDKRRKPSGINRRATGRTGKPRKPQAKRRINKKDEGRVE